jgi:hypothetical protein
LTPGSPQAITPAEWEDFMRMEADFLKFIQNKYLLIRKDGVCEVSLTDQTKEFITFATRIPIYRGVSVSRVLVLQSVRLR